MGKHRSPMRKNKYYMPHDEYMTAVYFSQGYPRWKEELSVEPDTSKAITYDKERVQTSNTFDPTESMAIEREAYSHKMELVETSAMEAVSGNTTLYDYLLRGVTEDLSVWRVLQMGAPIGERQYRRLRQRYYYLLSQKIL